MARARLHSRWWWLTMVLAFLSGYCLNVVVVAVAEGYPVKPSAYTSPQLSSYSSYSSSLSLKEQRFRARSNTRSPRSNSNTITTANSFGTDVVIFLRENCDQRSDTKEIQQFLAAYEKTGTLSVSMIQRSLTCETKSWGLGVVVEALGQSTTKAVIAALDENTCEVAARLAHLWDKPLVTWTCPLRLIEQRELSSTIRLSPSVPAVAQALAQVFIHFKWKTVAIVGTDDESCSSVDRSVIGALRSIDIIPKHHAVLSYHGTAKQVHGNLRPLQTVSCRAIVVCLPLEDVVFSKRVIDELVAIQQSRSTNSVIVLVHPEDPDIFLPSNFSMGSTPLSYSTTTYSPLKNVDEKSSSPDLEMPLSRPVTIATYPTSSLNHSNLNYLGLRRNVTANVRTNENLNIDKRFPPLNDPKFVLPDNILAIAPFDQRYDIEKIYNRTEEYAKPSTVDRLNESLNILTRDNSSINTNNNKMYTYGILAWRDNEWRPVLQVVEYEERLMVRQLVENNLADKESYDVTCEYDNDCSADLAIIPLRTTHMITIILGSLLFVLIALVIALLIRRHLLNKRMSKGPYKIVLTASDFVFPQVPDSRRVDEGIEAMLCCWLQQLHEFGGPEVEKPDLLQGSVGSLKPAHGIQTSTGSLVRHPVFKDPRARYNGDLVQLKELPCQSTFELKSKAMDVLVTIHGLRHENLNPLIGCLTDPARPCLVSEYCSRGSLEDVLVQDEIKLDWSFRLSLLTDLVRGMKYLHSSPIRVHGYLTSRNCVIDARWVLKVTDYGLPGFYDAQNLLPAAKTARDLLWTAPELLRHANFRKRGSQPGDVYSFGIIMQEVVVRGEPFCMLALSPEDIIEKVKKPPPLIRPSVSKGAAPPEAINIMRQCWAEAADMRPDFNAVHDLFKKLNHGRKVNFVDTMFQMLEKYSNNLEELIRERTEQLDMEKKKTEQLLNRMLPGSVAEKLKLGMPVDPEEFGEVTIYFSDIVGFTTISAYSTPFQVVDLLNDLYTCFDATINAYTVYKVETIGDAYMVVGGCPVRIPDHASQIATMALDLLHQSGKFKLKHLPKTQLRLRIGLNTGPCCAGVVGLTMPRYCLFGDTVNTASRMESTGAPWRIHLSQTTRDRLIEVGGYHIEYRGRTDIKGKGKMPTYWLLGKQGFDKQLPTPPPLGGLEASIMMESLASVADDDVTGEQPCELQQHPQPQQQFVQSSVTDDNGNSGGCSYSSVTSPEGENSATGLSSVSVHHVRQTAKTNVGITTGLPLTTKLFDPIASGTGRKIAVSVHDEKTDASSLSASSSYSTKTSEAVEILRDMVNTSDYGSSVTVTKSTSGDTQISLGTPVSATEVAAALLGASNNSLSSIQGSTGFRGRHRRVGVIGEDDLSTPYNHYRCLSPNEHYGKSSSGRMLKRQFSLDRPDEPVSIISDHHLTSRTPPRLYKQNSAGAANDLERIEEVPNTPGPQQSRRDQMYRHAASMSLSVESLTLR